MFIVLGGLGQQGKAIVHFLCKTTKEKIVVVDKAQLEKPYKKPYNNKHVKILCQDCLEFLPYLKSTKESGPITVISCMTTQFNLKLTEQCIEAGLNFIDLGGETEVTRQQFKLNEEAKKNDVCIIPDCGLAPGIISSLAAEYCEREVEYSHINFYCGGLPKAPELPYSYVQVFSLEGLVKEYTGESLEIFRGRVLSEPARSGEHQLYIPRLGILEGRRTSGGLSLAVEQIKQIPNLTYRTLRYPGHWDWITHLFKTGGAQFALERFKEVLQPVNPLDPDLVVLACELINQKGNWNLSRHFEYYFWEYDFKNNISAMSQATGYTAAAVALMRHEGLIVNGVVGMHEIKASEIIKRAQLLKGQYKDELEGPFNSFEYYTQYDN